MSRYWSAVPKSERETLYRRLALDLAVDEMVPGEAGADAMRPPRFDELYAAALDLDAVPAPSFPARLAAHAGSRRVFESLLRDTSICWFPAAAAAAGGDGLVAREEDGFKISIRPSSADGDQVYILIRLAEGRDVKPVALVAIPADGAPVRAALPEDIDGIYQLIELGDSAIARAIRDPASNLALV